VDQNLTVGLGRKSAKDELAKTVAAAPSATCDAKLITNHTVSTPESVKSRLVPRLLYNVNRIYTTMSNLKSYLVLLQLCQVSGDRSWVADTHRQRERRTDGSIHPDYLWLKKS
jgi:hypothetical protein